MLRRAAFTLSLLGGFACATPSSVAPLGAGPVSPGSGERLAVDHAFLVVDSSSSVEGDFATEKALVQSFVGAMPEGTYQTGAVAFGGYKREGIDLASFDRSALRRTADDFSHLSEGTPLDRVIDEVSSDMSGKTGRAAVVIFSDGHPNDPVGRDIGDQASLDAAARLAKSYSGDVCFHTVQLGDDAEGAAFLKKLAATTSCGSSRSLSSIQNVAALQNFEREVFFAAAQTRAVAAAPGDRDGDGVTDDKDACPGTPRGVTPDARGCWTAPHLLFRFDSAELDPQYKPDLELTVDVLNKNPDLNVRIDGYTDSTGDETYNKNLSERRAKAVREYLVSQGIDAGRLSTKGFGEDNPAYPNDTRENRQKNRRTEFTRAE